MVTLDKILKYVNRLQANRQVRIGLPLIVFLLVGSYGLSEFTQIRYEMHKRQGRNLEMEEELKKRKIKKKPQKSLEEVYDETVAKMDLNSWYNIRGPRPDEDSRAMQQEQREKHRAMIESQKLK